jgi:hypothetical protein
MGRKKNEKVTVQLSELKATVAAANAVAVTAEMPSWIDNSDAIFST